MSVKERLYLFSTRAGPQAHLCSAAHSQPNFASKRRLLAHGFAGLLDLRGFRSQAERTMLSAMVQRHRLERVQLVPAPRAQVFDFFSAAENLERLTPPFLKFRIITPLPVEMKRGLFIEYEIGLSGVAMNWLTEINVWEPNQRFVDTQLRGPYRYWHHLHQFRDVQDHTEMQDIVEYELPWGPLGSLAHALLVKRLLIRIFDYRAEAIAAAFPAMT